MENEWFECKVTLDRTEESGLTKKVTETYLLSAVSYTEAEARIIRETQPFATGGFEVADIRRRKIAEVIADGSEADGRWYRVKAVMVTLNESTGQERRTPVVLMIQAADFHWACTRAKEWQAGSLSDTEIVKIEETPVLDVYGTEAGD